jgi:hypothetical protein
MEVLLLTIRVLMFSYLDLINAPEYEIYESIEDGLILTDLSRK